MARATERTRVSRNGKLATESVELRVRLLGEFQVAIGTRIIDESEWYLRKAKNLVKLLLLAPGHRLHRGQLLDLLWSDLDPEAGANNLHKALHIARRVIEPDLPPKTPSSYLHMSGEFVSFEPPGPCWIDVHAFQAAADEVQLTRDPAACEEALSLYTGELLPEDRYEDWAIGAREALKARFLDVLLQLAEIREQRGEIDAAIDALRRVVAADPAHEQAHASLMRLLASAGYRQLALRQYQQLRDALRTELDAEPDPAVQRLYQQILSGERSVPQPSQSPSVNGMFLRDRGSAQPLIGRDLELARLKETVDELLAGRGALMFLSGPCGIGKSRLAAEGMDSATRGGAIALWGAAYQYKKEKPYGAFAVMLASFAARVPPETLESLVGDSAAVLAALAPTIAVSLEGDEPPLPACTSADEASVAAALTGFLTRLAEQAPVVVVLEDVHVADEASLRLLEHLAGIAQELPVLFLCTYRVDESALGGSIEHLRERLAQQGQAAALDLSPLSAEETALLVQQVLGGPVDEAVLGLIHGLAEGNPYYAEEAARALLGRSRILQVAGTWRLRRDIVIKWDRGSLRGRSSASGDYRLASRVRAS